MAILNWIKTHLPNLNDDNKLDDLALAMLLGALAFGLYQVIR